MRHQNPFRRYAGVVRKCETKIVRLLRGIAIRFNSRNNATEILRRREKGTRILVLIELDTYRWRRANMVRTRPKHLLSEKP